MNLNKLVTDKIKELGPTKAAAYFEVSVPTIYSWRTKGIVPVNAVQKVMDEEPDDVPYTAPETPGDPGPHEAQLASEPEVPTPTQEAFEFDEIRKRLAQIEQHLRFVNIAILTGNSTQLRVFAMNQTDPDAGTPLTSGIHPFKNPESGMQVKSAAEVIQGPPTAIQGKNWNVPAGAGEVKPDGWNTGLRPPSERNSPGGWNKPFEQTGE